MPFWSLSVTASRKHYKTLKHFWEFGKILVISPLPLIRHTLIYTIHTILEKKNHIWLMSKMIEKMQQKMTRVDLVLLLYLAFSILHAYKLFLEIFLHLDRLVNFSTQWIVMIGICKFELHFTRSTFVYTLEAEY